MFELDWVGSLIQLKNVCRVGSDRNFCGRVRSYKTKKVSATHVQL